MGGRLCVVYVCIYHFKGESIVLYFFHLPSAVVLNGGFHHHSDMCKSVFVGMCAAKIFEFLDLTMTLVSKACFLYA